ncbi:MAG: ATP-binding protein [Magnetospirillum sp.]
MAVDAERWFKRILPQGLLGRSLLIIVTPLIVVQLVSTYIFYASHWDTVARRLAAGLVGDVGAVIESLRAFPGPENRQRIIGIAANRMDLDMRFEMGGILPNTPPPPPFGIMEEALHAALSERLQRPFMIDARSYEREVAVRVQLSDGLLEVFVPRKRLFSSTTYIFVLWMVGTSLLLLGIATIFMRNQVRSVRKLAVAADAFGKGRDVANFKAEGAAEVRQAAQAFNLMRDRIKRQMQQRTEMLAGVSHDLRTPLTRMKLQVAMLGDADGRAELEEDVAEMEQMVEGYLAFVRGEGGEVSVPTDLSVLVGEVVGRFRREGRDMDLHVEDSLVMPIKPQAMGRVIGNLIGNALRYGGHVWVRVGKRPGDGGPGAAEIIVDDDGPGIPAESREQVFKPFFRMERSRNLATGGVGLGLTIARDIVRGHGGEVLLEDSPLGGLRARIRLPL